MNPRLEPANPLGREGCEDGKRLDNLDALGAAQRQFHPVRCDGLEGGREIYDLPEAPDGRVGCDDCKRLDNLMLLARKL